MTLVCGASLDPTAAGSLLVLQTGFPSGALQQYSRTGAAGATLALPVLEDVPVSLTVLDARIFVGDQSGRVSLINPATGAATELIDTGKVGLNSLGNYNGNLLTLSEFVSGSSFMPSSTIGVYSPTGNLLHSITLQSIPANAEWSGITSDGSVIYIADYGLGRIYEYSVTGAALGSFDTGTGFNLLGASYDTSNNSIWTSNSHTGRVYDFSTTGVLLSDFTADFLPAGVAVVPAFLTTPEPATSSIAACGFIILSVLAWFARTRPPPSSTNPAAAPGARGLGKCAVPDH